MERLTSKKALAFIFSFAVLLAGFVLYSSLQNFKPGPSTLGVSTASPSASLGGPICDQSLWDHVYHPQRLQIIEKCKTLVGVIISSKKEADGDFHIRAKLDADGSILVVEPICQNTVTQSDAVAACKNFKQEINIPPVGAHVKITGAYVTDLEHHWPEIHPVTSFEVIP